MKALPVIALTAHANEAGRIRALHADFDAYVSRPLDIAVLSRVVSEQVRRRAVG